MDDGAAEVRWAPRIPRATIRRLYESDAGGRLDVALLDEVFFGFVARCRSIQTVTRAAYGQVTCPRCGATLERRVGNDEKRERLRCGCGWTTTWGAYHGTYRDRQLFGGNAALSGVFDKFLERAQAAETPAARMLLVDWLVHEAHRTLRDGREEVHRPVAVNLIEGSMTELIRFLDELAYGPASTDGLAAEAERWRAGVKPRLGLRNPAADVS
jgi:hypothetical protein